MDTIDRPDANLPARLPASSPRLPAQVSMVPHELAVAEAPSPINSLLFLRGLARNWWRILLLWLVVSAPLVFAIYKLIDPTYGSSSTLRIEPSLELFGTSVKGDSTGFQPYLETQRSL